jgi:hypothetical protein
MHGPGRETRKSRHGEILKVFMAKMGSFIVIVIDTSTIINIVPVK